MNKVRKIEIEKSTINRSRSKNHATVKACECKRERESESELTTYIVAKERESEVM